MKISIDVWNWTDPGDHSFSHEIRIPIRIDLGELGIKETEILISGCNYEFTDLVTRLFRMARDTDTVKRVTKMLVETGHMLEGFQCPRCTMNAMAKLEPDPNPSTVSPS